ncbi:MAG: glutamine synthetase family protein [Solirubrobacteraceae bacterium]
MARAGTDHRDYVLRMARERDIRYVRMWFVDVLGLLKSVAIPVSELESALEDGVGIDGSSLEGSARLAERDVIAHPDPTTFQILPWRPEGGVARMFCDVRFADERPFPGDSRHALRRVLARAAELGFTFLVGCEVEFFVFAQLTDDGPPRPLDQGAYLDQTTLDVGSDFRRRSIDYLEQMGIPIKTSHHEDAPSQHEIDLQHMDALSMADAVTTFRVAVKEAARELGAHATFMPQPLEDQPGSGLHVHMSLFSAEGNVFHSPEPAEPLSPLGRQFLAGVLAHGCEMAAVTNQWVNSYKRLAVGHEAPHHVGWTRHGRSGLVRVPSRRPGREASTRIELRSPDPGCNPYLTFAIVLAAGLRGIERGYELGPEDVEPPQDRVALPEDLREATDLFETSELVHEAFGERLCEWYVRNKRREWAEYRATVSAFERRRYLGLL